HLWVTVAKNLSTWAAVGTIIALTGFGPEHWFAAAFRYVDMPQAGRAWFSWLDIRAVIVSIGVAIVVAGLIARRMRRGNRKDAAGNQHDRAGGRRGAVAAVGPAEPDTAIPIGRRGSCRRRGRRGNGCGCTFRGSVAPRPALDRGPPIRQHEPRSGAGIFQRW